MLGTSHKQQPKQQENNRSEIHPATQQKREAEGRTTKEIRRCIKRYLAGRVYRILNSKTTTLNNT